MCVFKNIVLCMGGSKEFHVLHFPMIIVIFITVLVNSYRTAIHLRNWANTVQLCA